MTHQKTSNALRAMIRRSAYCLGLVLVLVLSMAQLQAQSIQGSILGTVKDAKGAVVPSAEILLTSIEDGTVRQAKSNSIGDYHFEDIKAGHYNLLIQAAGFEKYEVTNVALVVRQELRIDAKLAVGTVTQEVKVTGDSLAAIETDSPTISGTFTSDDASNLPANTRASSGGTSAANIFGSLPGVQDDPSGISVQGALPYQVEVSVDGITVKSTAGGSFLSNALPSSESINEIRAEGVLAGAEFSDPGQVLVTTKGGTNKFHGSGFWYYQDSNFNATPYSNPKTNKNIYHANTFGGSIGGPVVIPHLYNGRDKSFFYGDYEGWRYPTKSTTITAHVPTAAMVGGDFSNYINNADHTAISLNDPFAYNTSWGTQVPTSLLGTAAGKIAQNTLKTFYPAPNLTYTDSALGCTASTTTYCDDGLANWQGSANTSRHSDQFDVRGDKVFGSKLLIWGKYGYKNIPQDDAQQLLLPSQLSQTTVHTSKVDVNWTITPSLVNEAGFGFTFQTSTSSNSFNGNAWTNAQGWNGLENLYYNGVPEMDFNNLTGLTADRLTSANKSKTYDYSDVLTWSKGRHTIKVGGNIQSLEAITPLGFQGADNYGTYIFNKGSEGIFTGIDFADFLLGLPYQTDYDVVRQDNDGLSKHYQFFGQDEWHVNNRLTLTLGVRYEFHPGYYDKYGDVGNFDPSVALSGRVVYPNGSASLLAQSFLASANACDADGIHNTNTATINGAPCMPVVNNSAAGLPTGLKKVPHLRFMPRVGFAFRPLSNDKWVIRGGAGMYNINMLGSSYYSLTGTIQAATSTFTNTFTPATSESAASIGYQWPEVYAGSGNAGCTTCYGTDYFGTANSINWKDPYTTQWTLGTEHDLGNGFAFRISYIGSETHQLVWAPDLNALPYSTTVSSYNAPLSSHLFPNWGVVNTRATGANESYNSLQAGASHRLQHGLEFNTTFTWAKALADNQGPANKGFGAEGGGQRATSVLNRHIDFGNVYGTRRLRWNTTVLYDLPFGRGKQFGGSMPRVADLLVGGWRLSNILTLQTGPYLTPYFPDGEGDPSGTGSGLDSTIYQSALTGRSQHPDRIQGVSLAPITGKNRSHWINSNAFTCPGASSWTVGTACTTGNGFDAHGNPNGPNPLPIGRFGNSGVGIIEGPGLFNLSSGISKSFNIVEGFRLKAEGTFTNVLNHTNLSDPDMNLKSSTFGQVNSAITSDFGGARTGQISLRLEF